MEKSETGKRFTAGELRNMPAYKGGENNYEEWIITFCKRKYNSDFSREMSRSVCETLRQFDFSQNIFRS